MKIAGSILSALLLAVAAGCAEAPTSADFDQRAREATAAALGGRVSADVVTVSGITRTMATSAWRAKTPEGEYACNADERFALPLCEPAGG